MLSFNHFFVLASSQLITSRIKYSRKPLAPSIPTPGQAYGYEEHEDGTLRKQEAPARDNSLGPAFYDVNQVNTSLSLSEELMM